VTEPGVGYVFFYYPPVFLLVCAALAALPYLPAFYLFQAVTLAPWLVVGRATLREKGALGWTLLLASPAIYWTLGLGQNSFLTAAALGGGLLLVDRRPLLAGLLLGLVCYKPHFGLLIPVALAAGGHWRAFLGAAMSVIGLALLSLLVFGWQTWGDYLVLFSGATGTYEHGDVDLGAFVTPFGGARLIGIPVAAAYGLQVAAMVVAAASVFWVWRRKARLPVRAAVLCAAIPVAVHVALLYDMVLSALAIFWLIRAARQTGWLPWEKTVLALVFVTPLVSRFPFGTPMGVPLGPLAAAALLAVAVLHARREIGGEETPAGCGRQKLSSSW
jgi:hypothetical protein